MIQQKMIDNYHRVSAAVEQAAGGQSRWTGGLLPVEDTHVHWAELTRNQDTVQLRGQQEDRDGNSTALFYERKGADVYLRQRDGVTRELVFNSATGVISEFSEM